jgi:hypothetical protein
MIRLHMRKDTQNLIEGRLDWRDQKQGDKSGNLHQGIDNV